MNVLSDPPSAAVPEWTCDALFAPERQSAARARSFVSSHLIEHRLLRLVDPVRAVAGELAANTIVHAKTHFTVTLSRTGPTVRLSVHDVSPEPVIRRSAPGMVEEWGHGLNLTAGLSRGWGLTADANGTRSIGATFDLRLVGDRGRA